MRVRDHLAPRNWPTWILLGAMRVSAKLPLAWLSFIGTGLGGAVYRLLASRRRIARINIDLCFPDKSEAERHALCKAHFHGMGRAVMETALAWWGDTERMRRLYRIEGLEHLERAGRGGRPVLLLTGHMSASEIGARFLSLHADFQAMYKPAKNTLFDKVMRERREKIYYAMVPRKQSRSLLRNLKNGVTTWYAPDQNFGREDTVFAPFFGVPATTLTATSRIVALTGATVVPYFPYRLPDNRGYRIVIHPPLEAFPGDSPEEDARRVNAIIEAAVRVAPEQYLWAHKRFRLRPPGEPPVY